MWGPLDDVVMGGVSQSGFEVRQGAGEQGGPAGLFNGQVSSSNNGGFASVSPPLWAILPLYPPPFLSTPRPFALTLIGLHAVYHPQLRTINTPLMSLHPYPLQLELPCTPLPLHPPCTFPTLCHRFTCCTPSCVSYATPLHVISPLVLATSLTLVPLPCFPWLRRHPLYLGRCIC